MHRSSSYMSSGAASGDPADHLPTYDPQSDAAKKGALAASRAHLAETLVHLIPLVIIFCALLLWSFSSSEVGITVEKRGGEEKMVARVKNDGWNGSGMMTGMEDLDPIDKVHGVVAATDNDDDQRDAGGREAGTKGA